MGLWDALRGRSTTSEPNLDSLFLVPSASVTLQTGIGLVPAGTGSVCFRAAEGAAFRQMQSEVVELLNADPRLRHLSQCAQPVDGAVQLGVLLGRNLVGPHRAHGDRVRSPPLEERERDAAEPDDEPDVREEVHQRDDEHDEERAEQEHDGGHSERQADVSDEATAGHGPSVTRGP